MRLLRHVSVYCQSLEVSAFVYSDILYERWGGRTCIKFNLIRDPIVDSLKMVKHEQSKLGNEGSAYPVIAEFIPLERPRLLYLAEVRLLLLVANLSEWDVCDIEHAVCLFLGVPMPDDIEETGRRQRVAHVVRECRSAFGSLGFRQVDDR